MRQKAFLIHPHGKTARETVRRATAWAVLLAMMLAVFPAAVAEEGDGTAELAQDMASWAETISALYDYESLGVPRGTKYPVYAAPYEGAWRGANGKAVVSTTSSFMLLGTADHGSWLWVYYLIDGKSGRVGWVYAPEAANEVWDLFPYVNELLEIREDAVPVTDDPFGSHREMATLHKGDQVIGLAAVMNPNDEADMWLYIEIDIEGQPAWGFIQDARVAKAELYHVEGNTLVIHEGVTRIGYIDHDYDYDEETGWIDIMEMDFDQIRGDVAITHEIDLWEAGAIRSVSLPSTLRTIGQDAFAFGHLSEFRVPDSVERIESWPFYGTVIDRFVLSGGFVGDIDPRILSYYSSAAEFVVEEGNPKYASRDGVLFSADMKTLILYPASKTATHYDVPKGVEIIGDYAFYDDEMENPLQTVSLPIGLKEIGELAFGGCGRLHSVSIPLTVTRVDETAFKYCVSLERVSAPPGIEIVLPTENSWAEAVNRRYYMGDNGFTGWEAGERYYYFSFDGWIIADTGEETVTVYEDDEDGQFQAIGEIGVGTRAFVSTAPQSEHPGFVRFRPADSYTWHWISMNSILRDPGDVYFTVSDADFESGKYLSGLGNIALREDFEFSDVDHEDLTAIFRRGYLAEEDGYTYYDYDYLEVPVRECTLYRRDGDRNATFGILQSSVNSPEIWLRDGIGGEPVLCLFSPYQCRVAEESGDWLRVHTIAGDGWVPRENFQEVYPKD